MDADVMASYVIALMHGMSTRARDGANRAKLMGTNRSSHAGVARSHIARNAAA